MAELEAGIDTGTGDGLLPDVELSGSSLTQIPGADVLALPFEKEDDELVLGPGAAEVVDRIGVDLLRLLERHEAKGTAGEVVEHLVLAADDDLPGTVLLVGVGSRRPGDLRRAGAAVARCTRGRDRVATSVPSVAHDAGLRAFVEGLVLGSFTFHRKTSGPQRPARRFVLAQPGSPDRRSEALAAGLASGRAGWLSRSLALTPSNEKNPAWMADRATEVAAASGLEVTVRDEKALAKEGFGGILGVGQASATPPRLVELRYTPSTGARRAAHVVLVGKGITFDTGGLSIKPAEAMMNMKRDMTGAGVVLAVMRSLAEVGCPVRVTGLLACAENAVDGNALRPGDVIRHYGGRTSEVTNTDAEGRLVLADALAYAVDKLAPTVLVDVATLTGAMKISLGQRTGGLFASDDALADHLLAAGRAAGEPLWRMPLADDYEELLESSVADADNAAGTPGAITAALFLRPFTGGVPWAHLDIASVGDSPVDAFEWTAGATGFGARALLHWLEQRQPLAGVTPPRRRNR
ncbi:leucyl aminopeptidase family protein [Nocardioides caldifontis]|uniref:leucyl aminopeptidase family protein n=1 Tax=Nocardioides caldifontis TaxID=2588938 RepID=UPI0011E04728|nr:leucyl aminopeptidase family protein [Nocardioides caldifontis]